MVRQFADPHAYYRELVQNSIDAGATRVDVSLSFVSDNGGDAAADAAAVTQGVLHIAVADDGGGMDQATIERGLLVLFRSTKDGDPTKIGKFGVGFFSVFAAGPR